MTTIEQLSGVPSASELAALANRMFPDLTETIGGVPKAEQIRSTTGSCRQQKISIGSIRLPTAAPRPNHG